MNLISDTAMVFAAGLGTRMRPLTDNLPKALIEINGKPLIRYTLDLLVNSGIKRAIINTYYKADMLHAYLEKQRDIEIIISHEDELLETGGGLKKAYPLFKDTSPIFTINSDVIFANYKTSPLQLLSSHWDRSYNTLLMLHPKEKAIGYDGSGDFDLREDNVIKSENNPYVFTGLKLIKPELALNYPDKKFSLNVFYPPKQLCRGVIYPDTWLHIGSVENKKEAEKYLRANRF